MKNNRNSSAFSLIEISIVVLIIGILIAGVTQSSRLVSQAKVNTAKSMTQSSPASSISDMVFWIEASNEDNFQANIDDGDSITTWADLNPQTGTKSSLASVTSPIYEYAAINGIHAVDFSAGASMVSANFSNISTDETTIFAVVKLPAAATTAVEPILSKRSATVATTTNLEFSTVTAEAGWKFTDNAAAIASFTGTASNSISNAYVVSFVYVADSITGGGSSTSTGYNFFQNGAGLTYGTTEGNNLSTASTASLFVGKSGLTATTDVFTGHIGEIIIYDRALKKGERQSVEEYLGNKWGITMTTASY